MSQAASPRGTFHQIADALKARIDEDQEMAALPPVSELMAKYAVSRGVVLRAFQVLRTSGDAEPVPGGRWRVLRPGEAVDRRPLEERIAAVITDDRLEAGAPFLRAVP